MLNQEVTHQITVRDADSMLQWDVDDWSSLVILASLSSEPGTLEELSTAITRYQPENRWSLTVRSVEELEDAVSADRCWCLIDLAGRTSIVGGGFEFPDCHAAYRPNEGETCEGFSTVWLDTPDDWLWGEATRGWQAVVQQRAATAQLRPRTDTRAVLFGPPLLRFLARRVLTLVDENRPVTHQDESEEELSRKDRRRDLQLIQAIHADWLMTAREDLSARTPRQVLLADRSRLDRELMHRADQWSHQGFPPAPLPEDSTAYGLGGYGTTQVVLYFDLVRALLVEARSLTKNGNPVPEPVLIERLADFRDHWLATPFEEGDGLTNADLIAHERARMPVTSDGSPIDCDCPICQAQADGMFGSGPSFEWFDGRHLELEDEFAFSLADSREEWEADQQLYVDDDIDMDDDDSDQGVAAEDQCAVAAAGSVDPCREESEAESSAWSSSYVNWELVIGPDFSPEFAKSAIGFPLAEIVTELQQQCPGGKSHVGPLNQAYARFRRTSDPVIQRSTAQLLCDQLEQLSQTYPELVARSADLQSHVDEVVRRIA